MDIVLAPGSKDRGGGGSAVPRQDRAIATSLLKGLDLLTVLARRPEGLAMPQLTWKLKLPRTSILRMLTTLEQYGLVARTGRRWCATEQFYCWNSRDTHAEIANRYRGIVTAVAREIDELTGLGIAEAGGVRYLCHAFGSQPGAVPPPRSDIYPMTATATGKLLLSVRPDLADAAIDCRLQAEIEEARATGVAWNRRECDPNVVALATWAAPPSVVAPVMFVAWPSFRFSEARAARAVATIRRELARLALPSVPPKSPAAAPSV